MLKNGKITSKKFLLFRNKQITSYYKYFSKNFNCENRNKSYDKCKNNLFFCSDSNDIN